MTDGHQHWLERAVARLHPEATATPWGLQAGASVRDAWAHAVSKCGLTPAQVCECVAEAFRLPLADIDAAEAKATRFVPDDLAHKYLVMPIREDYRDLVLATFDPTNIEAEQAVAFASGRSIRLEVADPDSLEQAVAATYSPDRVVEKLVGGIEIEEDDVSVVEEESSDDLSMTEAETAPVIRLANLILREAIEQGASDIHLQPTGSGGVIRYRVDGLLRTHMQIPDVALSRVVSRIKVIGQLDIADRIRPQDGRARIEVGGKRYDLRISTVPTQGSEKAVLRVLDTEGAPALETLGYEPEELERLRTLLGMKEGIVLVTGPTGSGKTTSLYAALRELAHDDVNIMTVEDPIEYNLPNVTQIQVNAKQNVTFASALRAILRQDPDIILVGEIRDLETAEMAVQAAMTGHVVLATLHTNDAAGTVRRLLDIGLEPAAIAESMRGAVAQRLVRKACSGCAVPIAEDEALGPGETTFFEQYGVRPHVRTTGCSECDERGYRGRAPVAEVMLMSDELIQLVHDGGSAAEIRRAATRAGMRGMRESGFAMVRRGVTTAEEIQRVLGESLDEIDEDENRDVTGGVASVGAPEGKADRVIPTGNPPGNGRSLEGAHIVPPAAPSDFYRGEPVPPGIAARGPTVPQMGGIPESLHLNGNGGVATAPTAVATAPVQRGGMATPTEEPDSEVRPRALICDDDATTRMVVKGLLRKVGFDVQEVGDGTDAVKLLKQDPLWDLMILDLDMPFLDGRDVLRVVRASVSTAALPIVVLTGTPDESAEGEVLDLGADDYLRKPIDAERLVTRVKATLRRSAVYSGRAL